MTQRTILGIVALVVWIAPATGEPQQKPDAPAFEVASIKPSQRDILQRRGLGCGASPGGRFSALGWFRYLVACAYDIRDARLEQRILSGPKWVDEDLYDIEARIPQDDGVPVAFDRVRLMLRTLLADRFKLSVRQERREMPTFTLVIARNDRRVGPRLEPTPKACADWVASGRQGPPPVVLGDLTCVRGMVNAFAIRNASMTLSQLVNLLSARAERPVIDATGLTGTFAIDLRWRPEQAPPDATFSDDLPTSIFTAVEEQLGLKLEPSKSVVDLLVIDHVERPTPN